METEGGQAVRSSTKEKGFVCVVPMHKLWLMQGNQTREEAKYPELHAPHRAMSGFCASSRQIVSDQKGTQKCKLGLVETCALSRRKQAKLESGSRGTGV